MKITTVQAFEKHLIDAGPNHFLPIYLLMGKDEFELKELRESLKTAILPFASKEAVIIYDAETTQPKVLLEELETDSIFSKKRLVILTKVEKLKKAQMDLYLNYFANPNPSVTFVMTAEGVNRATKFYKQVEKVGFVLDLTAGKPWEMEQILAQKVMKKMHEAGKKIDLPTAKQLVSFIGADHANLHQEVHKLACYVGERPQITVEDIRTICIGLDQQTIWKLGEAVVARRGGHALSILQTLLDAGEAPIGIIMLLRAQIKELYQLADLDANGATPTQMQPYFPRLSGRFLEEKIQRARQYGVANFKQALLAIDDAERKAKSSKAAPKLIVERLILKVT